jgi:hypothetical protein
MKIRKFADRLLAFDKLISDEPVEPTYFLIFLTRRGLIHESK